MRSIAASLTFLLLAIIPTVARADAITLFALQGALHHGGTASGTLQVGSTGFVVAASLTFSKAYFLDNVGNPVFTFGSAPSFQSQSSGILDAVFFESLSEYLDLRSPQRVLTEYAGGGLCAGSTPCAGSPQSGISAHTTGGSVLFDSLTASAVALMPEPSGLLLLGTGLIGIAFINSMRRRVGDAPAK